jgi:hypothetical protein
VSRYLSKQIEQFMALGEPREKLFLRWDRYESFCDDDVQAVLERFHPSKYIYKAASDEAFAVAAWNKVEAVAFMVDERNWSELHLFMVNAPLWTAELLYAVTRFHASQAERYKKPQTTIDHIKRWRDDRYLFETSGMNHEQAVKSNTLAKRLESEPEPRVSIRLPGGKLMRKIFRRPGVPAVKAYEKLEAPSVYMDGRRHLSPEAFRQAALRENRRRDKIMRHWADPWLAFLARPVTETSPKM